MRSLQAVVFLFVSTATFSTTLAQSVPLNGQCGGKTHTGPTTCREGVCTFVNEWYSKCVLGTANPPSSTATSNSPSTTDAAPLPSSFRWSSTGPLISPKNDSRNLAGVKDPSIVYHDGAWHVFATTAKSGSWGLFYTNFTTWSQAASAPFFYLDQSGIGTGYRAAPQIFYFAPQKLWYLVYQNGNAAYSTNPDISNPAGWTEPKAFYSGMPKIVEQHIGEGYWLDMWVICDEALCHLFSSDDNGQLYRSETPLGNFPDGFSEPVIALQDPDRFRLFEASNVYQYAKDSYLLLVEAIGTDERRWFRSWTSSSIAGPWKELAAEEENAFMRSNNVAFPSGTPEWTKDFSHGEMIRSGVDQEMKINPCKMVYFYQGMDPNAEGAYGDLPWRLALVTQTNSAC